MANKFYYNITLFKFLLLEQILVHYNCYLVPIYQWNYEENKLILLFM